jgi:hypothetical protein
MRIELNALGRASIAVLLAAIAGCESGIGIYDPGPIDYLSLHVFTQESEEGRHLLLVGEQGDVSVGAARGGLGTRPRGVVITSSDPSVVRVRDLRITGIAPGSAQIIAKAEGLTTTRRVDVVAMPLPITGLVVRTPSHWAGNRPTYDADGHLLSTHLGIGQSLAPSLTVLREGVRVTKVPFSFVSADPGVAAYTISCRPPQYDPHCSPLVYNGWVTGMSAGETTVTVTVRNLSRSFTVTVE